MNSDSKHPSHDPKAFDPAARFANRPRSIRIALAAALAGAILGGSGVWLFVRPAAPAHVPQKAPEPKALFQCPMHPTITADHPGDCPICGMKLVPVAAGQPQKPAGQATADKAAAPEPGKRKIAFYRSPMDPKITSPVPKKDEMGMDYLPVYEDELESAKASVPGLATVTIDPARQQLIGLRTAPAILGPVGAIWRTVGRVQVDPRRVRKISVKVEGYVERAFVDFVGQPVKKGEPLFSIYSPSLLSAQNEYLLALKTREALARAGGMAEGGDALVKSSRKKLELWDVQPDTLERLERTGQAERTLTLHAPISGVVTAKNLVEGARLNAGDAPYEVTDLGSVWVMADAYETDLSRVRVGMPATLRLQAYPGREFHGHVAFLDPVLDPKTRTLKVHLHVSNPEGELKPEMFGEVELHGEERRGLLIPADAAMRSGELDVVFLALEGGKFQPREVKLGARSGEQVEVLRGLTEGQRVVTGANFLVDSESLLRASLSALGGK